VGAGDVGGVVGEQETDRGRQLLRQAGSSSCRVVLFLMAGLDRARPQWELFRLGG
jgi:hypothetical protein